MPSEGYCPMRPLHNSRCAVSDKSRADSVSKWLWVRLENGCSSPSGIVGIDPSPNRGFFNLSFNPIYTKWLLIHYVIGKSWQPEICHFVGESMAAGGDHHGLRMEKIQKSGWVISGHGHNGWWWLEHGWMTWLSHHIGVMSSSQVTNSIMFQRGRYTTNRWVMWCHVSYPHFAAIRDWIRLEGPHETGLTIEKVHKN